MKTRNRIKLHQLDLPKLEKEKIIAEIEELRRPFYQKGPFWLTVLGTLASMAGVLLTWVGSGKLQDAAISVGERE